MNLSSFHPSMLTLFFSSVTASILTNNLLFIPYIFIVPLCHLRFPHRPIYAFLYLQFCCEQEAGWQWQLETLQQTKWVCLAVTRPGEVVALSSACDMGTGWSCQTKPVKCKTNLPIHLSESSRGRRRWYNCAHVISIATAFCFSRLWTPAFTAQFYSALSISKLF